MKMLRRLLKFMKSIIGFLFRRKKIPTTEPEPKKKPPRKWWEFPYRLVNTSRGGLNMPKKQPCPEHHGLKKRTKKTLAGAFYWCNRCDGEFFVRHP